MKRAFFCLLLGCFFFCSARAVNESSDRNTEKQKNAEIDSSLYEDVENMLLCLEALSVGGGRGFKGLPYDVDSFLDSALVEKDLSESSQILSRLVYRIFLSNRIDSKTRKRLTSHLMGYMVRRCGTSLNLLDDERDDDEKNIHDIILRYAKWGLISSLVGVFGYAALRLTEAAVHNNKSLRLRVLGFEIHYGAGGDDEGGGSMDMRVPTVIINNGQKAQEQEFK
jgi:hypothetical protein